MENDIVGDILGWTPSNIILCWKCKIWWKYIPNFGGNEIYGLMCAFVQFRFNSIDKLSREVQSYQNKYAMGFSCFYLLDTLLNCKKKQCITPPFNVVDATPYYIVGPCREVTFKGEETVSKMLFTRWMTKKKISHQTVHFKWYWNIPFVCLLTNLLPLLCHSPFCSTKTLFFKNWQAWPLHQLYTSEIGKSPWHHKSILIIFFRNQTLVSTTAFLLLHWMGAVYIPFVSIIPCRLPWTIVPGKYWEIQTRQKYGTVVIFQ